MRRSAFVLIVMLSLAAVSAVAFTAVSIGGRHITAWAMSQSASAGTLMTASLVRQVTIAQGSDAFTVLTTNPTGEYLAHSLSSGDVLRPDDLFTRSMVTVPLAFKNMAPGLHGGDSVDIYGPSTASNGIGAPQAPEAVAAAAAGQSVQLYGRGITVVAAGSATAVLVPAAYEGFWVDLSVSGIDLVAVLSSGVQVPRGEMYTLQQAEQMLAAIADGTAGSTPPASPAGG